MALNYNPLYLTALDAEKVVTNLLFKNQTFSGELVNFANTKSGTVFTETDNNITIQGYSCNVSPSGSIDIKDVAIYPQLQTIKMTFCPADIKYTRFQRDIDAGAWNFISNEFNRDVIGSYAEEAASKIESQFWIGVTQDTKDVVSATASASDTSTGEKALIASLPTSQYDGVLVRSIYSDDTQQFSNRIGVTASVITASNIATEYAKIYAAIPDVGLQNKEVFIYAPRTHRKLINLYNVNATYRDTFLVKDGKYFYNEVEIKFILDTTLAVLAGPKEFISFVTDLQSDLTKVEIGRLKNDEDTQFLRILFTAKAHIQKTKYFVLYA